MKNLAFTLLLSFPFILFGQNKAILDPLNTDGILKVEGGNYYAPIEAQLTAKISTSTSTPASSDRVGLMVEANGGLYRNTSIYALSTGSPESSSTTIKTLNNSTGYGNSYSAYFENISGKNLGRYGVISYVRNTIDSVHNEAIALFGSSITRCNFVSTGVYGYADNVGRGDAYGGYFRAAKFVSSTTNRIGVFAEGYGDSGTKYGLQGSAVGLGINIGLEVNTNGGNENYSAVLKGNSNPTTSFQLVIDETDNDYARICYKNNNQQSWHQAVFRGSTPAASAFNFYNVSSTLDVLSLRGNGDAFLAGTLTQSSDIRLKKNIQPLSSSSSRLKEIRGVYFDWNEDNRTQKHQIGFIAQEVEKVFPELVQTNEKGYKSVAYANMTAVLVEAIKEQNTKIEYLETEIANLKKLILYQTNSINKESK